MEKAAYQLPPVHSFPGGLPVYFLTGKKYLYQTLFCIRSLSLVTSEQFQFILVDDGTFDATILNAIERLLPKATVVPTGSIDKCINRGLPSESFPNINLKRRIYPHIRKLTDIHMLGGENWKLVLDSDMLFWQEPFEMIRWLRNPEIPLTLVDCIQSYGYPVELMERLSSTTIKPLLNVGAVGLKSNEIDWIKLEKWIGELEDAAGTSYYLEQALTAMVIGNSVSIMLPADEYIVNPDKDAIANERGSLHHYVDLSKKMYFTELWEKMI
ncbi:hypothetical protein KXD93_21175 [Mucilaginibacter sp. BJC16-A38]|uniref:hypothetical protein n=1 Tax=Mucilaginibacter phenanthrenivorans TaxID=1234842 RepID=UPI0021589599|nr:hypothetical protein [Mucilaginibacter phenanthrenivorans]MCR8560178.1 hypothetical protein [Mucilaginibacter phenanthrenivorans]